jgi:hypothetical protein
MLVKSGCALVRQHERMPRHDLVRSEGTWKYNSVFWLVCAASWLLVVPVSRAGNPPGEPVREEFFRQAEHNGRDAAEAFSRCRRYVDGWLAHADPQSGLIPRNLSRDRDLWNGRDAAADNYPFMVLTCALTDRELFEGRMREMLRSEIRLTSRVGRLCDDFLFSKQGFAHATTNLDAIMFDNSEYVKDGLIPLNPVNADVTNYSRTDLGAFLSSPPMVAHAVDEYQCRARSFRRHSSTTDA